MNFRPLHDRVLVRRLEQNEKTAGGIIIPDTAKEKPMEGKVVAAGTGTLGDDGTLHPLDVKAGDTILFGKWSGTEVKIDGEELIIMKESDILGIVTGSTAAAPAKKPAAPARAKPAAKAAKPAAKPAAKVAAKPAIKAAKAAKPAAKAEKSAAKAAKPASKAAKPAAKAAKPAAKKPAKK